MAPWHFTTWLDLFDHWQTFAAALLAVLAALGTIVATIWSANREIAASRAQTAVAQKQIDATCRLDKQRAARESFAFHAILAATTTRVLDEADEANEFVFGSSPTDGPSVDAYEARTHLTKLAFTELRAACVRYGGRLTLLRRLQLSPRRVLRRELEAGRLLRVEAADGHRSKVPRKRGPR